MENVTIIHETTSGATKVAVKKIDEVVKLVLDDTYVHSIYHPQQLIIKEDYWDYLLLGRLFLNGDPQKICVLGLGGGTVVHLFNHYLRPELIDAVEIDPVIAKVAQKYFDLNYQNLNIYVADAKQFVKTTTQKYELIVVDVFNPQGLEPSCNTAGFYANIKQRLTRFGVVAVNHFDSTPHQALFEAFDHVYAAKIHLNVVYFGTVLDLSVTEVSTRLAIFLKTSPDFEVFKEVKIEKIK